MPTIIYSLVGKECTEVTVSCLQLWLCDWSSSSQYVKRFNETVS